LRKYLIAAIAAVTALAFAVVATAQTSAPSATLTMKVTPKNAGTAKKPAKKGKMSLKIVNDDSSRTMDVLKITTPKTVTLKLKGLTKCTAEVIVAGNCPASAKLGSGIAEASQGVSTPAPNPLFFGVSPFPMSNTQIGFLLEQLTKDANGNPTTTPAPNGIRVVAVGTLRKIKTGQLLDIAVPKLAQEFPAGVFNGLVSLETTLSKTKGKHQLVNITGCTKKKHKFGAELHFIPNPNPAKAGTARDTATSACKK
jgi:hypothetical protein